MVFDGYNEISTKYTTQQRRVSGKVAPTVSFTESMPLTLKKENCRTEFRTWVVFFCNGRTIM